MLVTGHGRRARGMLQAGNGGMVTPLQALILGKGVGQSSHG